MVKRFIGIMVMCFLFSSYPKSHLMTEVRAENQPEAISAEQLAGACQTRLEDVKNGRIVSIFPSLSDGVFRITTGQDLGGGRFGEPRYELTKGFDPSWSPDGKQILYSGQPDANLFIMSADGTGVKKLTSHPDGVYYYLAKWSPDGNHIAFVQFSPGLNSRPRVMLMDSNGSNILEISRPDDQLGSIYNLRWLPDSMSLVIKTHPDGIDDNQLYLLRTDSGQSTFLANDVWGVKGWSADGKWISFFTYSTMTIDSINSGHVEIDVVSADGTQLSNITSSCPFHWERDM